MPLHTLQFSFASGEIDQEALGRADLTRYFASAQLIQNYRTTQRGAAVSRDGTQFIAEAKFADKDVRLEPFEFNVEQAYTLEIGEKYLRFYRGLNRLENPPGTPTEVVTPYLEADLFDLQVIQDADIAFFTHPDHPPQRLIRRSDTDWDFAPRILLSGPATLAPTFLNATLTLSATTGLAVTGTLTDVVGDDLFLDGDVDRSIISRQGGGIITALVGNAPATQVTINVLSPFASVGPFLANEWDLGLTPVVTLVLDKSGPRGAQVTITAEVLTTTAPEEIVNGNFQAGGANWNDLSAPVVVSGTHDGSTSSTVLSDSMADFVVDGVEVGHRVLNTTDVEEGRADSLTATTVTMLPGLPTATFNSGNTYEIRQTGSVAFTTGSMRLSVGENGIGHSEQQVTGLVPFDRYRLEFDAAETSVVGRIGSTSGGVDILAKTTFSPGKGSVTFVMDAGTTAFVGFSNEQATTTSEVDNVSMKRVSALVFRQQDVGKFVVGRGAMILLTEITDAETAMGIYFSPIDTDIAAATVVLTGSVETFVLVAGLWSLEEQSFSVARGFPRGQTFHGGRFWYLGTEMDPLTAWGSRVGDFSNFSRGLDASDSLTVPISANSMNTLEWGEPFRDLYLGTRGGEHVLTGGTQPISANSVAQIPQGTAGSPPIRPLRLSNSLFHILRGRRRIEELRIDPDVTQLTEGRDLLVLNPGITRSGVRQWTLQQKPIKTIWAVRADGMLVGLTLELLEQVRGWHRHPTQGKWVSVTQIPVDNPTTEATEQTWLVARRIIEGVPKHYIEVMIPREETETTQFVQLTLDSALRADGAPSTTFFGLEHLEGQTVALVQRDNVSATLPTGEVVTTERLADLGDQVVVNGEVTTPTPVSKLDVGLRFTPKIVTLRPEIPQDDGTLQARLSRWVRLQVRLLDSLGMTLNGRPIDHRVSDDLMDQGLVPRTVDAPTEGSNWALDNTITIEQPLALPSTVLAVGGDLEFEDVE